MFNNFLINYGSTTRYLFRDYITIIYKAYCIILQTIAVLFDYFMFALYKILYYIKLN